MFFVYYKEVTLVRLRTNPKNNSINNDYTQWECITKYLSSNHHIKNEREKKIKLLINKKKYSTLKSFSKNIYFLSLSFNIDKSNKIPMIYRILW